MRQSTFGNWPTGKFVKNYPPFAATNTLYFGPGKPEHTTRVERSAFEDIPVYYEHDINQEKIKYYSASARSFLSQLPVRRDCIILTTVPTVRAHAFVYAPSVETAEAVAKELGVSFVPAALDGLRTFDGSHLNQSSAERWSKPFFK